MIKQDNIMWNRLLGYRSKSQYCMTNRDLRHKDIDWMPVNKDIILRESTQKRGDYCMN